VDNNLYGSEADSTSIDAQSHEQQLAVVKEILGGLQFMSQIDHYVREHFRSSQVCLMPAPLAIQLLVSVKIAFWSLNSSPHAPEDSSEAVNQVAEDVLRSTKSKVDIGPDMDYKEFATLVSGAKLRVETLGFFYAVAARSYIYNIKGLDWDEPFMKRMVHCSNLCLQLARDVNSQTHDMLCSLAWENMQTVSLIDGDSSKDYHLFIGHAWKLTPV